MQTAFVDNSSSTTGGVETVTTPVGMNISMMDGPLNPVFTRPSLQRNRRHGSRHTANERTKRTREYYIPTSWTTSLMTIMVMFLRSSLLNPSSYMSLPSVKTSPPQAQPRTMVIDWYIPDRTNRRVVEISERKIADFHSPGGGTDALILTLTRLLLYYDTTKYLIDIDTGEVFSWITNQWRLHNRS